MKLLRETVRRLLLESSDQEMIDKLLYRGDNESFNQAKELADILDLEIQDVSQPSPVWKIARGNTYKGDFVATHLTFEQATSPEYMILAVDFTLLNNWGNGKPFIRGETYAESLNIIQHPVPTDILNAKSERTINKVSINYSDRTIKVS